MRSLNTLLAFLSFTFFSGCMPNSDKLNRCPQGSGLSMHDIFANDLPEKMLALTFDDGPSEFTPELLEGLKKENITATFFVIGQQAKQQTALLERMKNEGHLVGNHTFSHGLITTSSNPTAEVMYTDEIISPYVTGNMFLFRPPYGTFDAKVAERLNKEGITKYVGPINWDIGDSGTDYKSDTECWSENLSVEECAEFFKREIEASGKGSILLHDNHKQSVQMTLLLIPELKKLGYQFVRLDKAPTIRAMLTKNGGNPDLIGGPKSCFDY